MKRLELQNTNRPVEVILHWRDAGYLELNPPYQRGDVWSTLRQQNLIKSLLQGIPIASIIVNDRSRTWNSLEWGDPEKNFLSVIDGKQRMTAILRFVDGGFVVPTEWFNLDGDFVRFYELPIGSQRRFRNMPLAFCEASLPTLEAEKEVFELVNFGGVPQGESDN